MVHPQKPRGAKEVEPIDDLVTIPRKKLEELEEELEQLRMLKVIMERKDEETVPYRRV
jgi:hypothetical protein